MEADYERLRADARRPGQGRVRAQCYFAMRDNNLSGRLKNVEAANIRFNEHFVRKNTLKGDNLTWPLFQ